MLNDKQLSLLASQLEEEAEQEWTRLHLYTRYFRGEHDKPQFSPEVERAYGKLWQASTVNHMPLAVRAPAQRLALDGYRASREEATNAAPWALWQASGMDRRQGPLYVSGGTYGYAYESVRPASGAAPARIRPMSPRSVYCSYLNQDDDWPLYAWQVHTCPSGGTCTATLSAAEGDYSLERPAGTSNWKQVDFIPSTSGVVPFVKFTNMEDLDHDGFPVGEIEPLIRLQDQLNRISFIINLIAEKTSFSIKWMTGVEFPVDPVTKKPVSPWQQLPGEIWTLANDSAKMGKFDADNPAGFLTYRDNLRRDLFSLAQLPPHYGDNQMVNLSADALAAAEATMEQKVKGIQDSYGESHELGLRLAAYHAGDLASAADSSAQVWWRDASPRSLSQTVDAAGKAVQMLGVPQEAAWLWLPNVTFQDVEEWKAINARTAGSAVLADLAAKIEAGGTTDTGLKARASA